MDLLIIEQKFNRRLARIDGLTMDFVTSKSDSRRYSHQDWMFIEGLISTLWQYWSHFCRTIAVHSAIGCRRGPNSMLESSVEPPIWQRVSYIAAQTKQKKRIVDGEINSTLRFEPTWGDCDIISRVVEATNPSNRSQLISAFGVAQKVGHLQKVRNAAAHFNNETMAAVMKFAPLYVVNTLPRHPVEAVFWVDPESNAYAIETWTEEMRAIASLAIR